MPRHIDAETLRGWLEEKRPVTVLDVRTEADRAEWSIPGSIHVDAYEQLKAGTRSAVSDAGIPANSPVVTVCNLGRMSERAADELSSRGIEAFSLVGGMKAWSLAWNIAGAQLTRAHVIQVRRTGKGCLSYVISSGTEALVLDASLPPEVYLRLAEMRGVHVRYVLETHIHADHLSRSKKLSDVTGAKLLLPRQERVRFPYERVDKGTVISIGGATLETLATPGHTMESCSYLLDGEALFTGDTLFTGAVGRPDLKANVEQARARAAALYDSVCQLFALGPDVVVFPGHTSEPSAFDGVIIAERLRVVADRLGERLASRQAFVEGLIERLPATPPNYERIVEWNEAGELPAGDPTDLEAGANRCAAG